MKKLVSVISHGFQKTLLQIMSCHGNQIYVVKFFTESVEIKRDFWKTLDSI